MDDLNIIVAPIKSELQRFESLLDEAVRNPYPMMGEIVDKLVNLNGKRMRPILTLLVAKMVSKDGECVDNKALAGAVIMEITHNASLIHDDVIDEAHVRRGKPTLNASLRSKGAVLAGDFLLACGIELGVKYGNYRAIQIAARTLKQLVEGELQQAQAAATLSTTKEDYFGIINLKTAYLLAASAEVGTNEENVGKMYRFGELIGQAYQIKDDILDYVGDKSGKELFNDIVERKITLPMLYAFDEKGGREEIVELIKVADKDPGALQKVAHYVTSSGAIKRCELEIENRKNEALEILKQFEDSDAKNGLIQYCNFVTKRDY